ncbi:MAG: hypothetical protein ACLSAH_11815 [Bilophila wadsworthia]
MRTARSSAPIRITRRCACCEDGSEYGLTGTLQFADVSVDESTSMVTLRAIFPNPKQELLPGMYVRAI